MSIKNDFELAKIKLRMQAKLKLIHKSGVDYHSSGYFRRGTWSYALDNDIITVSINTDTIVFTCMNFSVSMDNQDLLDICLNIVDLKYSDKLYSIESDNNSIDLDDLAFIWLILYDIISNQEIIISLHGVEYSYYLKDLFSNPIAIVNDKIKVHDSYNFEVRSYTEGICIPYKGHLYVDENRENKNKIIKSNNKWTVIYDHGFYSNQSAISKFMSPFPNSTFANIVWMTGWNDSDNNDENILDHKNF